MKEGKKLPINATTNRDLQSGGACSARDQSLTYRLFRGLRRTRSVKEHGPGMVAWHTY